MSGDIFKAYDIRGLVSSEITPDLAYKIGRGFGSIFLGKNGNKKIVVGRDARPSSQELEKALIRGLREEGVDVISIGLVTTPLFYFAVNVSDAAGGIMVTASHNPPEYNGFKITKEKAIAIGLDSGLDRLRDFVLSGICEAKEASGGVTDEDFRNRYIEFLTKDAKIRKFTIAADLGNGMAGVVFPELLARLGIKAEILYSEPDGTFPNHEANPLKEETLRDLQNLMKEKKFDFGVAFDGDGDRIGFLLQDGTPVKGDIILALLAEEYLMKYPGSAVVYAVNCSRIVPETIKNFGGVPVRAKVGHTLVKAKMRETGAVLGGEISTHYFYKDVFGVESAMLTLVRICEILTRLGKNLDEAIKPFLKYAKSPEINFSVKDKSASLRALAEFYNDGKQDLLDGLTVEYPNWWFNARPSNTEPLLRLNVEAESRDLLERKVSEIKSIIKEDR